MFSALIAVWFGFLFVVCTSLGSGAVYVARNAPDAATIRDLAGSDWCDLWSEIHRPRALAHGMREFWDDYEHALAQRVFVTAKRCRNGSLLVTARKGKNLEYVGSSFMDAESWRIDAVTLWGRGVQFVGDAGMGSEDRTVRA